LDSMQSQLINERCREMGRTSDRGLVREYLTAGTATDGHVAFLAAADLQ